MRLGLIVEGHGDVLAIPTLASRVCVERLARFDVIIGAPPIRINRSKFSRDFDGFPKALKFLAPQSDGILVVLDSDDDDPAALKNSLELWANEIVGHVEVRVAPAVREYESWFLACVPEMAGRLTLRFDAAYDREPEAVRDAKGEFRKLTSNRIYSETVDQKKFSAILDIDATEARSPSFAQFVDSLRQLTDTTEPAMAIAPKN